MIARRKACKPLPPFVSVVSGDFVGSGCKVNTFIPNMQMFFVKKHETLKNSCFSVYKKPLLRRHIPPHDSCADSLHVCFFEKEKCYI